MASEGASGADQSGNDKSSDQSSKADRAECNMSDKSRDALSGGTTGSEETEVTAEDRAASQDRMAAESQAAKDRVEAEAVDPADDPDVEDHAACSLDSSDSTPEDQADDAAAEEAADAEEDAEAVDEAEVAASGTYADSYLSQGLSGVNEGIANVLGGPVDLVEAGLNLAMDGAEALGVPESVTPEFENSFLGSDHIKDMMTGMGSIGPESADPTKQAVRDVAEIGTEIASVAVGGVAVAGRTMTSQVDDVAEVGTSQATRTDPYNIDTSKMTLDERAAIEEYAQRTNAYLDEVGGTTLQSTAGSLRSQASAEARRERMRAERAGTPYQGQAGHVPDTAFTGLAKPPGGWLDMPGTSNNVAGGGLSSRLGQRVDHITVDGQIP